MSNPRTLEDLWTELASRGSAPVHLRVDESHPLDLYAGLDVDGSRLLVLLAHDEAHNFPRRFQAFEMTTYRRQDGRWALSVHLRRPEFGRIFAHLCQDLVDSSRACGRNEGARFFVDRVVRWERLLARDRSGLLDESSLRGLVGELLFIEQCALPARRGSATVQAWYGPLDADQDFRFADRLIEVKTSTGGSLRVVISSAEQLDVHDAPLFLTVVVLDRVAAATQSFTLPELVERIRQALADEQVLMQFEERLALTGYTTRDEYDNARFVLRGLHHFLVGDGFPRLRRSQMPSAIGDMHYELDLSRCHEFERASCFNDR